MSTPQIHQYHIPVLGLCYSVDTALKVARYGISSVLSIVEDQLLEEMREHHSLQNNLIFSPISEKDVDHRAKRITAYLNLLDQLVNEQFAALKAMPFTKDADILTYFELLPEDSLLKKDFLVMMSMPDSNEKTGLQHQLKQRMVTGAIDVNIMAKLDNPAYTEAGERMPDEFCDAMSALRGFANSNLSSSIVFSAGYNPRLFNYAEQFEDFFPDTNNQLKKKIIIKVSDYRSALVQGKILAKKGLWVSEFRIESGINCGGHAFPTEGLLLGPILAEFKTNRKTLSVELFNMCNAALVAKGKMPFKKIPSQKISAQGGVGTAEEQQMLLQYFQLDSIGWGSPFLLVPEVTNVDDDTLHALANAEPQDYFMSNASPLGVPFNNFRKSSAEAQRKTRIANNKAGSPCYQNYLATDTEFTELPICTASRQYQRLKEKQIRAVSGDDEEVETLIKKVSAKDCLCEGLTSSVRLKKGMKLSHKLSAVTICPGPNLAWFSGIFSLKEMTDHIYGRTYICNTRNRPHMFVNELKLYVDYLHDQVKESTLSANAKQARNFQKFKTNLLNGIAFYKNMMPSLSNAKLISAELNVCEKRVIALAV
jgi:hypothetical protein